MRTRQITIAAILRVSTVRVLEHHVYQTGNYCSYIQIKSNQIKSNQVYLVTHIINSMYISLKVM